MSANFKIREAGADEKRDACEPVLRALPEWFGIEEAIDYYLDEIQGMTTYLALDGDAVAGFMSITSHNPYTAEIHVMGVYPEYHRRGAGTALVEAAERWSRERGHEFLEVKTLGPSRPHEPYARTRAFYMKCGFLPLEEIHDIWPGNPCLIMVKKL